MDHPEGAHETGDGRLRFDRRVRMQFLGAQISSDDGLLVMRELDDTLGLSDLASAALRDSRTGKNTLHRLDGLFRQSVFGRLAGYEDVNDADRLALDPVMQLMAIFGWTTMKEASRYTRAARQKVLAASGMKLLSRDGGGPGREDGRRIKS